MQHNKTIFITLFASLAWGSLAHAMTESKGDSKAAESKSQGEVKAAAMSAATEALFAAETVKEAGVALAAGADATYVDAEGSLLHRFTTLGLGSRPPELITWAKEHGVDPLAVDERGFSPLMMVEPNIGCYIAPEIYYEKVRRLIEIGVPVHTKNTRGVWRGFSVLQKIKYTINKYRASDIKSYQEIATEYEQLLKVIVTAVEKRNKIAAEGNALIGIENYYKVEKLPTAEEDAEDLKEMRVIIKQHQEEVAAARMTSEYDKILSFHRSISKCM